MRQRAPFIAYGDPLGWPGTATGLPYERAVALLAQRTELDCYVLAIDQAERAGFALRSVRSDKVLLSGFTVNAHERRGVMRMLGELAGFSWQRTLVVFEDHSTIPLSFTRGTGIEAKQIVMAKKSILSLGASLGRWDERLHDVDHPVEQRIRVDPREWRRVLSVRINMSTDAWKGAAKHWATCTLQRTIADDNEAEAIVMSRWGAVDGLYRWAFAQRRSA